VLQKEIFDPLGMKDSSDSAAGIEAAPNHAEGYRYDPGGSVEAPFTPIFPYAVEGAGALNSNVEDMVRWLRLQLGDGAFEGKKIVSPENLAATLGVSPRIALRGAAGRATVALVLLAASAHSAFAVQERRSRGRFRSFPRSRTTSRRT
jgi:CubicO group peptidase (beta-lactamase class C family)